MRNAITPYFAPKSKMWISAFSVETCLVKCLTRYLSSHARYWRFQRTIHCESNARFPSFRCRSSVAVSPFPLAVSVHRCRCRCRCRCVSLCLTERIFLHTNFYRTRNFTTAERRNGNGWPATEWWKPGITLTRPMTSRDPKRSVSVVLC